VDAAKALLAFVSTMNELMTEMGHADGAIFSGLECDAKPSEIASLYRVFLLGCLESLKVSAEDATALAQLRAVLGLSESQTNSVYEAAAGPLLRKTITAAIEAEMGPAEKEALGAKVADLALPTEVSERITMEVYDNALGSRAEGSKILDEAGAAELLALRDFLGLAFDAVEPAHANAFSEQYLTSVRQVIKADGAIPDEYWSGLEQLQGRLGLGEPTAMKLFGQEAALRMKELGDKAAEALQKKAQAEQKAQQEGKGEMGIDANDLLAEIFNIIDFAEKSRVLTEEAASVTLREQIELRMLKEIYRQFLVEAFSGKSPENNQKILGSMGKLSLVLGLDEFEVDIIHNDLGALIYRQYCKKALQTGPLGVEERGFLDSIKGALSMDAEKCEKLIYDCQLFRVSTMVEAMFESAQVKAEESRKVRDTADSLDVDLQNDAGVPSHRLERMFLVELEDIVDSGELTTTDTSALEELCEPLHISEEKAQAVLETVVSQRINSGVLQAAAALRGSEATAAVEELETLLKYAMLAPTVAVKAPAVKASERNELVLLYQANALADGSMEGLKKEKLDLLTELIGAPAAASA